MCSASFLLCFSSPTQIGLVSPIPEQSSAVLRRHRSFAVCLQASPLFHFLRHSCPQTSTSPRYHLPIHPSPWEAPTRQAVVHCLVSTRFLGCFGHQHLSSFFCPWSSLVLIILVQTDYFDSDFFFPYLTWHQEFTRLTKESMGFMQVLNLGMLF